MLSVLSGCNFFLSKSCQWHCHGNVIPVYTAFIFSKRHGGKVSISKLAVSYVSLISLSHSPSLSSYGRDFEIPGAKMTAQIYIFQLHTTQNPNLHRIHIYRKPKWKQVWGDTWSRGGAQRLKQPPVKASWTCASLLLTFTLIYAFQFWPNLAEPKIWGRVSHSERAPEEIQNLTNSSVLSARRLDSIFLNVVIIFAQFVHHFRSQ